MHLEILDQPRIDLLKEIVSNIDIGEYYLAGGTALSLQLGLRKSVDFDFFVPHKFNTDALYTQLADLCPDDIRATTVDDRGTCEVIMNGIKVSFFEYQYDTVYEYVRDKDLPSLAMASIEDIAAMKVAAIGGRGSKKDFFDLYEILTRTNYSVKQLVDDVYEKFGESRNYSYMAMALNYFADADSEHLPETFVKYNWGDIKLAFLDIQKEFVDEISNRESRNTCDINDDFAL